MAKQKQITLEHEYKRIISSQKDYLSKLQNAFNNHCDEIARKTAKKIANVPKNDKETRKKIFIEQKRELDEGLKKLKNEIKKSSSETQKKLEEINSRREEKKIKELENMIQHLE